jgi:hypothetical protein
MYETHVATTSDDRGHSMQTRFFLMCPDFRFETRCVDVPVPAVLRRAEPHAYPRKAGAEKSRDVTIYGECGANGPTRPRGACPLPSILFPLLKPLPSNHSPSFRLPSFPLGFPQYPLNGSLSISPHTRTVSHRPPTGYDLPCVRFFRFNLPIGDTISLFWGVLLLYLAN